MIKACFLTAAGAAYTAARWDRNENHRERLLASRWLKSSPAQDLRDANLTDFYYRTHHRALADKVSLSPVSSFLSAQGKDLIRTLLSSGTAALSFYNLNLVRSSTTRPLPQNLQWLAYGAILTPVALKLVAIALDAFSNYTRVVSAMERVKGFIEGFNWLGALGLGAFYAYSSRKSPLLMAAGVAMAGGALAQSIQLLRQSSLEDLPEQVGTRAAAWIRRRDTLLAENTALSSQEWQLLEEGARALIQGAEAREEDVNALLDRYLPYRPCLGEIENLGDPLSSVALWDATDAKILQTLNPPYRELTAEHLRNRRQERVYGDVLRRINSVQFSHEEQALREGIESVRALVTFLAARPSTDQEKAQYRQALVTLIKERLTPYIVEHREMPSHASAVLDLCKDLNGLQLGESLEPVSTELFWAVVAALPSPLHKGRWGEFLLRASNQKERLIALRNKRVLSDFSGAEKEKVLSPNKMALLILRCQRLNEMLHDELDDSLKACILKSLGEMAKESLTFAVNAACSVQSLSVKEAGDLMSLLVNLEKLSTSMFSDDEQWREGKEELDRCLEALSSEVQRTLLGSPSNVESFKKSLSTLDTESLSRKIDQLSRRFHLWSDVHEIVRAKEMSNSSSVNPLHPFMRNGFTLLDGHRRTLRNYLLEREHTAEDLRLIKELLLKLPFPNTRDKIEGIFLKSIENYLFGPLKEGKTISSQVMSQVVSRAGGLYYVLNNVAVDGKATSSKEPRQLWYDYFGLEKSSSHKEKAKSLYNLTHSCADFCNSCREDGKMIHPYPFKGLKAEDRENWGLAPLVQYFRWVKAPKGYGDASAPIIPIVGNKSGLELINEGYLRKNQLWLFGFNIQKQKFDYILDLLTSNWKAHYEDKLARSNERPWLKHVYFFAAFAEAIETISARRKFSSRQPSLLEAFAFSKKLEGFLNQLEEAVKAGDSYEVLPILGKLRALVVLDNSEPLQKSFVRLQERLIDQFYGHLVEIAKGGVGKYAGGEFEVEDFDYSQLSERHKLKLRYIVCLSSMMGTGLSLKEAIEKDPGFVMADPDICGRFIVSRLPREKEELKSLINWAHSSSSILNQFPKERQA